MYAQKTRAGTGDVNAFVDQVEDPVRRADSLVLLALMQEASGEKPVLWGSMIGFGHYHYRYASGHEGDSFLIGFAPRKAAFSLYLLGCYFPDATERREALLARLGKHRLGKGCLYVKRLSDIDLDPLRELAALSVHQLRAAWPDQ